MPDYRRKRIIQEFGARLEAIQQVNGYETDAGRALFYRPISLGADDARAALVIMTGPTATDVDTAEVKSIIIPIEVHALVRDDLDDALLILEDMIGDVKRAVELPEAEAPRLNGLVTSLLVGEVEPLVRPDGSRAAGAVVGYRVMYTETWGAPEA